MTQELWLDNIRIELPEKKVSQTYQINDLSELQDRQLNYTNRFTAPLTPNNVKAMDYLGKLGNNSSKPYKRIPARYVANGIELMPNGFANVKKTGSKGYEINIYDGNASLYETLKGKRLSQLNYQDLNHHLNLQSYEDSLTNTSGYIYALGDFGNSSLSGSINIDRQAPAVFIHTLWDKIFQESGFTYEGVIFSDTNFLNEVITPTKGYTPDDTGETEVSRGAISTNTVIRSLINQEDPLFFSDKFTLSVTSSLTELTLTNNTIQVDYTGILKINCVVSYTLNEGSAFFKITNGTSAVVNKTLHPGVSQTNNITISINVKDGDILTFYLDSNMLDEQSIGEEVFSLDVSASATAAFTKVSGGQYVDFSTMMPDKSQIDFIKDVMQTYGLMFQSKRNSTLYTFKKIEELLNDRSTAENWTEKAVVIGDESYRVGAYAQDNYMRYSYEEEVEEPTHDGILIVDNDNLQTEKTLFTSIYRISKQTYTRNTQPIYLVPIWTVELEQGVSVIKNLETEMRKFTINRVAGTLNFNKTGIGGTGSFTGDVPHLSLLNIQYDFYIGNYYPALKRLLNKQVKRLVEMKLSIVDIYQLDFFKLKYFKQLGQYFYLNKVSNYVIGKPVVAEFIQAVDLTVNQPPSQVGDKSIALTHGASKSLNLNDFTATTPIYADPEFDQPENIKFISGFDSDVVLKNNGVAITAETIVNVATMNLTLEEQGVTIPEHSATIVFSIQSFNSPVYSTDTGSIIVTVPQRINYAPVSEAGSNRTLVYLSNESGDGQTTVFGNSSYDPNPGDALTYLWTVVGTLPTGVTLTNSGMANATLVGTGLTSAHNNVSFTMRLRVTDPFGLFNEDECTVTLLDLSDIFT